MAFSTALRRRTVLAGTAAALTTAVAPAVASPFGRTSGRRAAPDAHGGLREALEFLVGTDRLAGAAVLVDDPGVPGGPGPARWTMTAGTADVRTGRPMDVHDRMRAGSVTKTLTSVVVLQLAAEGRVSLEAPVDRYLPGLIRSGDHDGRRISVEQLLRHTSGLPDHLEAPEWNHPEDMRERHFEPREMVARALELPAPQAPWHYSTTNYLLAGLIVEAATGRSPEEEITRRVLGPSGMRDSYWPYDELGIRGEHSRSYHRDSRGRRVDGTDWNMTFGGVGGALVSTPVDLARFARALSTGRLLPPDLLTRMRRTVPADPERLWPGARYGLGLISSPLSRGGSWWGHAGTVPGGHRAFVAAGPTGRVVSLVLNERPATLEAEQHFLDAVDAAFCEGRPTGRTEQ